MTKKKLTESAGGRGERDIGSDAYADYTKNITPGQSAGTVPPANPSITSDDAKKADKKQKEDNAQKHRQATVVDDEFHPRVPMPVHEFLGIPFSAKARLARQQKKGAKLKTRTDLATAKMSNIAARDKLKQAKAKLRDMRTGASAVTAEYQPELDETSVPDQTGINVSKKMAGTTNPPKQAPRSKRMAKGKNLAPAPGWSTRPAGHGAGQMTTAEYQPETVDRSPDKSGGKGVETPDVIQGVKVKKLKPSLKGMSKARRAVVKTRSEDVQKKRSPGDEKLLDKARRRHAQDKRERSTLSMPAPKEEVEVETLIGRAVNELSKKTLGRYVKSASHSATGSGIDLGVSAKEKGQTRGDVDKHVGKIVKRQKGIGKAVDKLSQEDMSLAPKGKGRKAAKRMYGEDTSIVDAVQEVLGLGNKWPGMEKMPPVDKKTGKYVTGKSKIQRLPKHRTVGAKGGPALSGYENKKEEVEMDEKNWIKGAIKNPGSLRKSLDVPAGENIPARKLASAAKEGGKMGKRARLAQTLKKMHNEFVPENGDHPPKKAHKHDKKDKPEQGKVYALTGKSSEASIARGDSWKKSEVKK